MQKELLDPVSNSSFGLFTQINKRSSLVLWTHCADKESSKVSEKNKTLETLLKVVLVQLEICRYPAQFVEKKWAIVL